MPYTEVIEDGPAPLHLLSYAAHARDTFAKRPLGVADALVLAELATLRFEDVPAGAVSGEPGSSSGGFPVLRDYLRAELYDSLFKGFPSERSWKLLCAVAASPRFRDLEVRWPAGTFDEDRAEQFAAVTLVCPGAFSYAAFRGTDGTLVGWRENLMMAYRWPVSAQADAAAYLERVAADTVGALYAGGHSKGGNLAVYAAVKAPAPVCGRLAGVYCFDGPGFRSEAFSPDDYARVADRVHKYVPEESMVGLIMEAATDLAVVRSEGRGTEQHETFRWQIDPEVLEFVQAEGISEGANRWRRAIDHWMRGYSDDELEAAAEALVAAVSASDAEAAEVFGGGLAGVASLVGSARTIDAEQRRALTAAVADLRSEVVRATRDDLVGQVHQRYQGALGIASSVASNIWELATGTEDEKARARAAHEERQRQREHEHEAADEL